MKRFKQTLRLSIPLSLIIVLCCALFTLPAAAFSDVAPGSWYEKAVTQMTDSGQLSGYPDGTFRPNQTISTAEFVAITARRAGLSPVSAESAHWAAGYTQAALQTGWYDWDEIPPTGEKFNQPITRQLAVKIIMKAFMPDARGDFNKESSKIIDFSQLDGRYYEAVLAAYSKGIVTGDSSGTFRPKSGLSRAEACVLIQRAGEFSQGQMPVQPEPVVSDPAVPPRTETIQGGVSKNGWLKVVGASLCNDQGQPVVLRGMSSHGLQWYGQFASSQAIKNTADYGANLFRIAMYTDEDGYLSNPDKIRQQAISAIDAAVSNDMYVIIDWHILSDGNPMFHVSESEAFFTDIAQRYKDNPAVLYEICNEPNGNVSWQNDIKPYAQRIINTIRSQSPKSIILVGSGTWSQDIHIAAADPLQYENIMYTLHFYAGTHGNELRNRIDQVMTQGFPVFVSEWGTSRADGSGGVFINESCQWLDFLNQRGISWTNWSLCDKNETSAALRPGTSPAKPWTQAELTESGKFVFSRFNG